MKRIFAITLALAVFCAKASAQAITPTTEAEAVGLYSSQDNAWHAGEVAGMSVKVVTFGTVSQHNLYAIAHELSVPDFHQIAYMAGVRFQPDISGWLGAHTVLPTTIAVHFEAEAGNTVDTSTTTSVNHVTQRYGLGVSVPIYDSSKGEVIVYAPSAHYTQIGSVKNAEVTAGIAYVFGGGAAQETAKHRATGKLSRAKARAAFKNAGW